MRRFHNRIKLFGSRDTEGPATESGRILVPIDFSVESKKALSHAMQLAAKSEGTIILLHVIETLPLQATLGFIPHEIKKANLKFLGRAEAVLTSLCEAELDSHIRYKVMARVGVPYQAIVDTARASAVDLIIVTTHSCNGLKRVFVGNTVERVVRYAPCAVLVLRA